MKRYLMAVGLVCALAAPVAARDASEGDVQALAQQVTALSVQIQALTDAVGAYKPGDATVCASAPTRFRVCRTVNGVTRCGRRFIEAVN